VFASMSRRGAAPYPAAGAPGYAAVGETPGYAGAPGDAVAADLLGEAELKAGAGGTGALVEEAEDAPAAAATEEIPPTGAAGA
jgi:hypothetical protein